ncbi:MAG: alpha/beta hydrolase [Candidatus Hodarchaeota archaeon]
MPRKNQTSSSEAFDRIKIIENPIYSEKEKEFLVIQNQMLDYYEKKHFEKGLEFVLEAKDRFPENPTLIFSWLISFLEALGKKDEKLLETMEEACNRGAWWSRKALFEILEKQKDHPKFKKIAESGEIRHKKALASARAELLVRTPKNYRAKDNLPSLLVLHGRYASNENSEQYWKNIVDKKDIILASLQSSQMISGAHFVWDDNTIAFEDLQYASKILVEHYRTNPSNMILAGISQGAELALIALFSGLIPATGFISMIPSVGNFSNQFISSGSLRNVAEKVKGCIIAGENDPRYDKTKNIYQFLINNGITCQLYSYPGLDHQIPDDYNQILLKSVNFILGEESSF